MQLGPFDVEPVPVDHPVPAFGLRVTADGRHARLHRRHRAVRRAGRGGRGADLLLAEASFRRGEDNPPDLHLTGADGGAAATRGGVGGWCSRTCPPGTTPRSRWPRRRRSSPARSTWPTSARLRRLRQLNAVDAFSQHDGPGVVSSATLDARCEVSWRSVVAPVCACVPACPAAAARWRAGDRRGPTRLLAAPAHGAAAVTRARRAPGRGGRAQRAGRAEPSPRCSPPTTRPGSTPAGTSSTSSRCRPPSASPARETAAAAAPYDQTFRLHSRPTATRKVYLDFDGHAPARHRLERLGHPASTSRRTRKDGDAALLRRRARRGAGGVGAGRRGLRAVQHRRDHRGPRHGRAGTSSSRATRPTACGPRSPPTRRMRTVSGAAAAARASGTSASTTRDDGLAASTTSRRSPWRRPPTRPRTSPRSQPRGRPQPRALPRRPGHVAVLQGHRRHPDLVAGHGRGLHAAHPVLERRLQRRDADPGRLRGDRAARHRRWCGDDYGNGRATAYPLGDVPTVAGLISTRADLDVFAVTRRAPAR